MLNPIFVFDLHGVLFKPDYQEIAHILRCTPKKYNLFMSVLSPQFWSSFLPLAKKGAVPEELIMKIGNRVPRLHSYIETGIQLSNAQKPQEKTIDIVQKLKKRGFKQYIFSNIGERIFADLYQKYPKIIDLFDGVVYTHAADDYLKKPHPKAFEKYAKTCGHALNDIIFIDNKRKNIRAAVKLGIKSILFKNSEQLYQDLKKKNFLD